MSNLTWALNCFCLFCASLTGNVAAKPCSLEDIVGDWIYTEEEGYVFCLVHIDATGKFQSSISSLACRRAYVDRDLGYSHWRLTEGQVEVSSQCRVTGRVKLSSCYPSTGYCYNDGLANGSRNFFAFLSNDLSRITGRLTRVYSTSPTVYQYLPMEFILLP